MDESGKKALTPSEINREQAKAAQKHLFDLAAQIVNYINTVKPLKGERVTDADREAILKHRGVLAAFRPELMDEQFAKEVVALIRDCGEILNQPGKDLFESK